MISRMYSSKMSAAHSRCISKNPSQKSANILYMLHSTARPRNMQWSNVASITISKPILPNMIQRNFMSTRLCSFVSTNPDHPVYITSPIFYVNAVPHIGHLYSAILADSLKRWFEFKGQKTMYSTGTDEHGLKIQQVAEAAKSDPKEFCNDISKTFKSLFKKSDISYTRFIRTTDSDHYEAVKALWECLERGGFLYKGYHEGWYCVSDETFYPESQIEASAADPSIMISKESGKVVEWTKEENYKFKLSAFRDKTIEWLKANPKVIVPESQYNFVLSQLKKGEQTDLSVSRLRSRISWGIPVPNDDTHVIYVWLDALVNYLTVAKYPWTPSKDVQMSEIAAQNGWPAHIHVVGKDIIKFHAIYWPAFLMAAGLPLPQKIISHGHWLMNHQKMSKSVGNVVEPNALIEKWGVDPVRYFLMRDGVINNDPEFSDKLIFSRYKNDLGDQLGNLVMRVSTPRINQSGEIPLATDEPLDDTGVKKMEQLSTLADQVDQCMIQGNVADALQHIQEMIADLNKYWTDAEPWKMANAARSDSKPNPKLQSVLFVAYEGLRICALLLQPVMPTKMTNLLDTLDVDCTERTFFNAYPGKRYYHLKNTFKKPPTLLSKQPPLFPRIDQ
ncbi:methionyl-tRNA synthetase [Batrachochytrium dendrobatidis]